MKMTKHIIIAVISFLMINSCKTIHEFPDEPDGDNTIVNIDMTLIPLRNNFDTTTITRGGEQLLKSSYDIRYIIEIYPEGGTKGGSGILERKVITKAIDESNQLSFELPLNAKKYTLLFWADYVAKGASDDLYYSTENLLSIKIKQPYVGSEKMKEAFAMAKNIDLTPYQGQTNINISETVELTRPFAKYEIVTTDLLKYIDKITKGDQSSVEGATTKLFYHGYFPSGYNVMIGKPNDTVTGLSFSSPIEILSENEGRLVSDYVWVNGAESGISVSMIIYDKDGDVINQTSDISIPIKRGMLTLIKGGFFTGDYSPGIGIDPGFDGEFEVVIPD